MKPLGNDTITIVKPTLSLDTVGNATVIDFENPTLIVIRKCAFEPFLLAEKLQFEDVRDRSYSRSTWRVWIPPTDDALAIEPHDRIRFDGVEYELFGHIGIWKDFNGKIEHVQLVVQLRTG